MASSLDKWRTGDTALDAERRLMNEALGRLTKAEGRIGAARSPARLVFGLDLTGSREAGLKQARIATAAMFDTIRAIGRIELKLVHYRGTHECSESAWCDDAGVLRESMLNLSCQSGNTQIAKLLKIVLAQNEVPSGVVFVGDHCEEEEAQLLGLARTLGSKSIPLFMFHECADHDQWSLRAKSAFQGMAEASGGVYAEFRPDSAAALKEMLSGIAVFSTAGVAGLARIAPPATAEARRLHGKLRLMLGAGGDPARR